MNANPSCIRVTLPTSLGTCTWQSQVAPSWGDLAMNSEAGNICSSAWRQAEEHITGVAVRTLLLASQTGGKYLQNNSK